MSEDERDVRERLRQHVRERLRLLKEERRRQTRQANASHGEITEVAPDVVEELPTSQKKIGADFPATRPTKDGCSVRAPKHHYG